MIRLFAVLVTILAVTASVASIPAESLRKSHPTGRIVGGKPAEIVKHPHQVSIRYKICPTCPLQHTCGGNIINEKIILTAAHCIIGSDPQLMRVVAGTNEPAGHGLVFPIKKLIYHIDYERSQSYENDIGIIVLDGELPLNNYNIKPIQMTDSRPATNKAAHVTGWGLTSENGKGSDLLLEVDVVIVSNTECELRYGPGTINKSMLCAGTLIDGKGPCHSDSGGPLVVDGVLVGIVSWALACASSVLPTVYASVADLRPWIDSTIEANM